MLCSKEILYLVSKWNVACKSVWNLYFFFKAHQSNCDILIKDVVFQMFYSLKTQNILNIKTYGSCKKTSNWKVMLDKNTKK